MGKQRKGFLDHEEAEQLISEVSYHVSEESRLRARKYGNPVLYFDPEKVAKLLVRPLLPQNEEGQLTKEVGVAGIKKAIDDIESTKEEMDAKRAAAAEAQKCSQLMAMAGATSQTLREPLARSPTMPMPELPAREEVLRQRRAEPQAGGLRSFHKGHHWGRRLPIQSGRRPALPESGAARPRAGESGEAAGVRPWQVRRLRRC